jgi:hypothetical protein
MYNVMGIFKIIFATLLQKAFSDFRNLQNLIFKTF